MEATIELVENLATRIGAELARQLELQLKVQPTLTLAESAEQMGVSQEHVRKLCVKGELPAVRLGPRLYRIKPADINRYIEKHYNRRKES